MHRIRESLRSYSGCRGDTRRRYPPSDPFLSWKGRITPPIPSVSGANISAKTTLGIAQLRPDRLPQTITPPRLSCISYLQASGGPHGLLNLLTVAAQGSTRTVRPGISISSSTFRRDPWFVPTWSTSSHKYCICLDQAAVRGKQVPGTYAHAGRKA